MYIHFFHGRKTVDEELSNWGEDGPVVPVAFISWTYGTLKLHDEKDHLIFLNETEGLIRIGDVFYGDFELLNTKEPFLEGKAFLSLQELEQLNRRK